MGKSNFSIDFIQIFANIVDGEFFKGVHQAPHDPGGSGGFCPDYLISFCLKSFLSGYR